MVRGGYGILFDNPSLGASANGALARLPQPTRLTPPNITAFAPNYQVMYGHNASLQVQRQVLKDLAFRVQYSYWSRRLQLSSTWSWSHAIAEGDLEGGALTDPTQRSRDRGNANASVRYNWVMQGLWAPEVKWLKGFETSSVVFFNSGYRINPLAATGCRSGRGIRSTGLASCRSISA